MNRTHKGIVALLLGLVLILSGTAVVIRGVTQTIEAIQDHSGEEVLDERNEPLEFTE